MHLVQLLLPVTSSAANTKARFETVLDELTTKFGGVTATLNSPAAGLWDDGRDRQRDRIVTVEVMVDDFDGEWGSRYRARLEEAFEQEAVVVRAMEILKV
jgi:hypothetical protein